ncbi:hypothetical protein [Brevundimonas sp.]
MSVSHSGSGLDHGFQLPDFALLLDSLLDRPIALTTQADDVVV